MCARAKALPPGIHFFVKKKNLANKGSHMHIFVLLQWILMKLLIFTKVGMVN